MVITRKAEKRFVDRPPLGCRRHVEDQIARSKPERIFVLRSEQDARPGARHGGSTGYGPSSRSPLPGGGADTINVSFEREPREEDRHPGWYNTKVFKEHARKSNLRAFSVFGDVQRRGQEGNSRFD